MSYNRNKLSVPYEAATADEESIKKFDDFYNELDAKCRPYVTFENRRDGAITYDDGVDLLVKNITITEESNLEAARYIMYTRFGQCGKETWSSFEESGYLYMEDEAEVHFEFHIAIFACIACFVCPTATVRMRFIPYDSGYNEETTVLYTNRKLTVSPCRKTLSWDAQSKLDKEFREDRVLPAPLDEQQEYAKFILKDYPVDPIMVPIEVINGETCIDSVPISSFKMITADEARKEFVVSCNLEMRWERFAYQGIRLVGPEKSMGLCKLWKEIEKGAVVFDKETKTIANDESFKKIDTATTVLFLSDRRPDAHTLRIFLKWLGCLKDVPTEVWQYVVDPAKRKKDGSLSKNSPSFHRGQLPEGMYDGLFFSAKVMDDHTIEIYI